MWKYVLATGKRSLDLEEYYVEIWTGQESRGTLAIEKDGVVMSSGK